MMQTPTTTESRRNVDLFETDYGIDVRARATIPPSPSLKG